MTPRNWNPTTDRLMPCDGSNRKALSHWRGVGICPGCGVRTFIKHGIIKPHKTSRLDVAEFRRRGPRQARAM